MKKLLLALIIVIPFFALSQDFRKSNFGDSKAKVKSVETAELLNEDDGAAMYRFKLAGLKTYIFYIFTNNQLVRCRYSLAEEHINNNLYISDYEALLVLLKKKYGEPKQGGKHWEGSTFKDMPDLYGDAVAIGELMYYSVWEKDGIEITLFLQGDDGEIDSGIEYVSSSSSEIETKAKEKEALDQL